jgi:sugar O-acyltransferase (sialic acid O-acetyltransferase NeuD family)
VSRKPVVIFGTADFARVAAIYLRDDSDRDVAAFTVHERFIAEPALLGLPVVPFEHLHETHPPAGYDMLVAIGFKRVNHARAEIYDACKARGYTLISYVSSKATRMGEVAIGDNCFIFEHNVLQPSVTIGNDVVLWSGNHIGHDSRIGDHCFIASHVVVSGNVTIGPYCFVGVNATFRDAITVGAECIIGAGAIMVANAEPKGVYAPRGTERLAIASDEVRSFR